MSIPDYGRNVEICNKYIVDVISMIINIFSEPNNKKGKRNLHVV
jgi:hypothetical protein